MLLGEKQHAQTPTAIYMGRENTPQPNGRTRHHEGEDDEE